MRILVYEDSGYEKLYPLNMLRATFDIKCGSDTILERIKSIVNEKFEIELHCRNVISEYLRKVHNNVVNKVTKHEYLLLNGRVIFSGDFFENILTKKKNNSYYKFRDEVIAAYTGKDYFEVLKNKIYSGNVFNEEFFVSNNFTKTELKNDFQIRTINYPWEAIANLLHGGLEESFEYFLTGKRKFQKANDIALNINHKKIFIGKNVKVLPQVVLDASDGRIVIDDNSKIESFSYVRGPAYIGKNCLIKSGSKIYGPCVIGEYSKVAGEIAESIFHSYVNKQHDGFIGHSYICPFVNLGADTVTSDLKNNYSDVSIKRNDTEIDTKMKFLGSIIGDHSKTSINTMLNTGSIIGIFANIFGSGFPDKTIKPFSWNETGKSSVKYDLDKAINTAKIVMERRGVKLTKEYEDLLNFYYQSES